MTEAEINIIIGRRIRLRRRDSDMTMRDLGLKCGVSFQQVQKHEVGAAALTVPRLVAFAHVLNTRPESFLEGLTEADLGWTPKQARA